MKKLPCEVIQDLLPLYSDDVCSAKSKELVEKHLTECKECRDYYASLKEEFPMLRDDMNASRLQESEKAFFKKIKHDLNVEKYLFTALVIICIIIGVGIAGFLWMGVFKTKVVVYEDYQGPNLPLSFVTETEGIIADREIEVDYTDYEYSTITGDNAARKVKISDKYILTNTTDEDIVVDLAYGFVGDYGTSLAMLPQLQIDGNLVDSELVFGRSPLRYGADLENREGYEELLEGGVYKDEAFDSVINAPVFSENVYVYRIKSAAYNENETDTQLPYGRITFTFDPDKTEVYSWGFSECDEKNETVTLGFNVTKTGINGFRNDKYIIAVGDALQMEDIKYYKNSNSMKEVKDFTLELEEYNCTFDEILEEIVVDKKDDVAVLSWGTNYVYNKLKADQILTVGKQYIADMRELNIDYEYAVLDLESYMFNMYGDSRVSYQTVEVTIPANGSIELLFDYEKCTGIKKIDDDAYDGLEFMTSLGSNIDFENQTLRVVGLNPEIISEYTTGEEIENGQYEVDLNGEYFEIYLEVPEKEQ